MGDWKGIRQNIKKYPDTKLELYNLKDDPGELYNVAGNHPEVVNQMETYLKTARTEWAVWQLQ